MQGFGILMAVAAMAAAGGDGAAKPAEKGPKPPAAVRAELVQAQPPPFSDGIFPCSQCHDPKTAPPQANQVLRLPRHPCLPHRPRR